LLLFYIEQEKIEIKPKKSHRGRKSADYYDNDYVDPFNDDMLESGKVFI